MSDPVSPPTKQPTTPVVYYLQPQNEPKDDDLSLIDLWRAIAANKALIASATSVGVTIALIVAMSITPVYRADVTLAPVSAEEASRLSSITNNLGGLASLAGINIGPANSPSDQALAVLRSRAFTDAFIEKENLLPILFEEQWDAQAKSWRAKRPEDAPTVRKGYELFDQYVRFVNQDKKSRMLTLSIEWRDPQLAANWANLLVQRLNEHEQQAAIAEAEKSLAYLRDVLNKTSVLEMQQAIYRLIEVQTKNIMLAKARDQFAFTIIDPAVAPEKRSWPDRKIIVLAGLMLGLIAGIGAAIARSILATKTQNRARNVAAS